MANNIKVAPILIHNREHWLLEAAKRIQPLIEEHAGREMPKYRLSVGWPSRGGLAVRRPVIGQCWQGIVSPEGFSELFISPMLGDEMTVLGTIAHELVHTIDEGKSGHKGRFVRLVRSIGLAGKPTATVPGEEFKKLMAPVIEELGKYPHAGMTANPNAKVQSTRMIKVFCVADECGYTTRLTRKWLEKGAPICPVHYVPMITEEDAEDVED